MLSWYGIWITEYVTWNRGEESRAGCWASLVEWTQFVRCEPQITPKIGAKTARPLAWVGGSAAPQTSLKTTRLENGDWGGQLPVTLVIMQTTNRASVEERDWGRGTMQKICHAPHGSCLLTAAYYNRKAPTRGSGSPFFHLARFQIRM